MGISIYGVFQKQDPQSKEWKTFLNPPTFNPSPYLLKLLNLKEFFIDHTKELQSVKPLVEERGLPEGFLVNKEGCHGPEDLTDYELDSEEYPYMGEFYYNWFMASEFLEGVKNTTSVCVQGIVSREVYEAWDKVEEPWCYGESVSGRKVIVVNQENDPTTFHPDWTHIHVTWERPMQSVLHQLYEVFERNMREHGDFRFVYGFST